MILQETTRIKQLGLKSIGNWDFDTKACNGLHKPFTKVAFGIYIVLCHLHEI